MVTGDLLQCIYSVLVAKNHQKFRSRCLIHECSFTDIFNDIKHGYRAPILKENYLWRLPFFMVVANYCYYEKVGRTMRTVIVSCLLNSQLLLAKNEKFRITELQNLYCYNHQTILLHQHFSQYAE